MNFGVNHNNEKYLQKKAGNLVIEEPRHWQFVVNIFMPC